MGNSKSKSNDDKIDNETDPLIRKKKRNDNPTSVFKTGVCTNRICLLIFLAIFVACSMYYQETLTEMEVQLQNEEKKTAELESIIQEHELVIKRFDSQVTNKDLQIKVEGLEKALNVTTNALKIQIANLDSQVQEELTATVSQLNVSVHNAEQVIKEEVAMVKKDVEVYVRTTQDQFSMENSFMIYQLAMTFMLLSCLISMWHMTAHLRKFKEPIVQRKILAILWMCPVYAITSWFSLVFHQAEPYLAVIRDFYEAYVIYQFLSFCICVLGRGDRDAVIDLMVKHADHLTPPFRFDGLCNPDPYENDRALAEAVLLQCQGFAMQFVFLRPLTTVMQFMIKETNSEDVYGSAWYLKPQLYITVVQNLSVFVAFTGLLKFYHAVDKDLAWCRPFAKFLCIKGVVFMTFWQGLAIHLLANSTDAGGEHPDNWATSAQNFLLCLEMLLFSICHFYSFPTAEWQEGYRAKMEKQTKMGDTLAFGDFIKDMRLILSTKQKKKKKKKKKNDDGSERDISSMLEEASLTESFSQEVSITDFQKALEIADTVEKINQLANLIKEEEENEDYEEDLNNDTENSFEKNADDLKDDTSTDDLKLSERASLLGDDKLGKFYGEESHSSTDSLRSRNEELLRPSIFTSFSTGSGQSVDEENAISSEENTGIAETKLPPVPNAPPPHPPSES